MRPRILAGLLMVVAAGLHFGFTQPARSRATSAADEYKRLREARRGVQAQLTAAERRRAARVRALEATAVATQTGRGVADARRAVVEAASRSGVAGVRVSARPGVAPVVAVVRVAARGSLRDVLQLTAALVGPGSGLALGEARYQPTSSGLDVELTLLRVGAGT